MDRPVDKAEGDTAHALRTLALAARPHAGWAMAVLGLIALLIAWAGVSGEVFVAKQLPYLVSGGIGGLALLVLAGILLGTHDLNAFADRLDNLEEKVDDIHRVLVLAWGETSSNGGKPAAGVGDTVARVAGGASYHDLDCFVVTGKDGVRTMTAVEAAEDGLTPCRLCLGHLRTDVE